MNRTKLYSGIAAAMLGLSVQAANAEGLAQAVLDVTDVYFYKAGTMTALKAGTAAQGADISLGNTEDLTDAQATLNGTTVSDNASVTPPSPLDLASQCVGDCGAFGENDWTEHNAVTTTVARSDTLLTGTPIDYTLVGGPAADGADAHSVDEVQIQGAGDGTTQSNLKLVSEFQFIALDNFAVDIAFNWNAYAVAYLSAENVDFNGALPPNPVATASIAWNISLSQQTGTIGGLPAFSQIYSCLPGGLNVGVSTLTPGADQYDQSGSETCTTPTLTANSNYKFTISHTTFTDLTTVPTPATLALLGLGLVGVARTQRKRMRA